MAETLTELFSLVVFIRALFAYPENGDYSIPLCVLVAFPQPCILITTLDRLLTKLTLKVMVGTF